MGLEPPLLAGGTIDPEAAEAAAASATTAAWAGSTSDNLFRGLAAFSTSNRQSERLNF